VLAQAAQGAANAGNPRQPSCGLLQHAAPAGRALGRLRAQRPLNRVLDLGCGPQHAQRVGGFRESLTNARAGAAALTLQRPFAVKIFDDFEEVAFAAEPVYRGSRRVTKEQKRAAMANTRGPGRDLRQERIPVPPEVEVLQRGTRLYFSGPLGVTAIDLSKVDTRGRAAFKVEAGTISVVGPCRAFVGTVATLIRNKVTGVVRGYLVYLQLQGVGYRVSKETKAVPVLVPATATARLIT